MYYTLPCRFSKTVDMSKPVQHYKEGLCVTDVAYAREDAKDRRPTGPLSLVCII